MLTIFQRAIRVFATSRRAGRASERGVALILVIIFLSLMLLLGLATTMSSITEVGIGRNVKLATEAFDVADAGSSHAFELVRNMRGDFTCLLRGNDANLKNGDEFTQHDARVYDVSGYEIPQNPVVQMFDTAKVNVIPTTNGRALVRLSARHFYELIAYDNAYDTHAYLTNARLEDTQDPADSPAVDCDQRVLIRSIGYVMPEDTTLVGFDPRNAVASAVVDIVIGLTPFPAVISDRDLVMQNGAEIHGALGSIHANDDLTLGGGSWQIDQSATFSNQIGDTAPGGSNQTTDNSHVAGFNGYSDPLDIPDLNPYDYADRATYVYIHKDATVQQRTALMAKLGAGATAAFAAYAGSPNPLDTSKFYVLEKTGPGAYVLRNSSGGANLNNYSLGASAADRVTVSMATNGNVSVDDIPDYVGPNAGKTLFFLIPTGSPSVNMNSNTSGQISLITNGNIGLNGNANLRVSLQLAPPLLPPWDRIDLLALAGEDVVFSGSAAGGDLIQGVIYAHEGFDLTGSGNLSGQVIGKEHALVWNALTSSYVTSSTSFDTTNSPVPANGSIVRGNFELRLDTSRGYLGTFAIAAWRQLRDFDPLTAAR